MKKEFRIMGISIPLGFIGFFIAAWGKSTLFMMIISISLFIVIPLILLVSTIALFIYDKKRNQNYLLWTSGYSIGMVIAGVALAIAFNYY